MLTITANSANVTPPQAPPNQVPGQAPADQSSAQYGQPQGGRLDERYVQSWYTPDQVQRIMFETLATKLNIRSATPEVLLDLARKNQVQRWAPNPGQSTADQYRYEPRAVQQWAQRWVDSIVTAR